MSHQSNEETQASLRVVVIGGGPVGLAALAYLVERQIPALLLESGDRVGANLADYGHVRLFSPWRYCIADPIATRLEREGWERPHAEALPLAGEIVDRVLAPYARLPEVRSLIRLRYRVVDVTRDGFDKVKTQGREAASFVLRVQTPEGLVRIHARAVIDASGTWSTPNPVGASGLAAVGEEEASAQIHYGIPDVLGSTRARYAGKTVLVVGSGHSAANSLLALAQLADTHPTTRLVWAVRSANPTRAFGGGEADALPARGELGAALRRLAQSGNLDLVSDFRTVAISRAESRLTVHGLSGSHERRAIEGIDEIICATGQRPDLAMTRELRLKLDPWLESTEALGPLIDPNVHSCGTVRPHGHRELAHPEPGFYTLGVKSYGRAPTFLMTTGFEQARSVVAAIVGDIVAADRVELKLPETGVCGTGGSDEIGLGKGCCGAASPAKSTTTTAVPASIGKPNKSCATANAR